MKNGHSERALLYPELTAPALLSLGGRWTHPHELSRAPWGPVTAFPKPHPSALDSRIYKEADNCWFQEVLTVCIILEVKSGKKVQHVERAPLAVKIRMTP